MEICFASSVTINGDDAVVSANMAGERLLARGNLIGRGPNQRIDWKVPVLREYVENFRHSSDEDSGFFCTGDQTGVRHAILLARTRIVTGGVNKEGVSLATFDMQSWGEDKVRFATKMYRLTSSEAALAASMVIGRNLQAHADLRGATIATVRKQLSTVYAKTHTTRQIELVATLRLSTSEIDTLRSTFASNNN